MPESLLQLSPIGGLFVLDLGWPISYNEYKSRHWPVSKKGRLWRQDTVELIHLQCGGKPDPLVGRVHVYWEIWAPDDRRRRDPDNYSGKHCLDALVHAGIISDDSMQHVVRNCHDYRGKWGKGCVLVTVMEV